MCIRDSYDSTNNCYSPVGTPVMVVTKNCGCYNDPNLSTAGLPVNHGITLLKRAGSDNGSWPMIRSSAPVSYTHLDVYKRQDYSNLLVQHIEFHQKGKFL